MSERNHHQPEWDEAVTRWYCENYGEWPSNEFVVEAADLKPDSCVLDIGCGGGQALRLASEVVTKGRLVGVEPTPLMLQFAKEHKDNAASIEYLAGAAESLPLANASVDIAWAVNTLHHWRDIPAGLTEAARVIRPGGQLILAEDADVTDRSAMSEEALRSALEQAGFMDFRIVPTQRGEVLCYLYQCRRGQG
ncbi:class I SAM-dependent methyltransferase [Hahella aquimaris]|uniref:class I SAM-dependent methyltransferase n=1 Tax=Hahella sp. HNIBRBA332 TaxID=3015983 RepID=UPI00273B01B7|nr:class I SAM-dependent methyltransferase [Hahella sp. HNIBRBA332]WLQ13511.1 class I SAM-dependent methyltransferase [Hahella sp. HNIBRBA332]